VQRIAHTGDEGRCTLLLRMGTPGRLRRMGKFYASAASYLLALAAQLSGWTSPILAAGLAIVGTLFFLVAAWDYRKTVRAFMRGWRLRVPWERVPAATAPASTSAKLGVDLSRSHVPTKG
jgi:hypothetical protein